MSTLAVDPAGSAIVRITIDPGDVAVQYNFSEVLITRESNPPPPGPPPFFPPASPTPITPPPLRRPTANTGRWECPTISCLKS